MPLSVPHTTPHSYISRRDSVYWLQLAAGTQMKEVFAEAQPEIGGTGADYEHHNDVVF